MDRRDFLKDPGIGAVGAEHGMTDQKSVSYPAVEAQPLIKTNHSGEKK
jgi:hypothetical protein